MQDERRAARGFLAVWITATVIKVVIAARLPLFVDEAFYWQEGRHLAAAYSDLPALTAWLVRLGTSLGGEHVLAVRAPFLLLGMLLPWLVARCARPWFGAVAGWHAGALTVLMPLSGTLGLLALPDVPMAIAAVLCADAGARLLRSVDARALCVLALGLVIGGLSHYRFLGVIGLGLLAMLWLPDGRRLLRDARVWFALAIGAAAWLPLLAWNVQHADAGLRFQLMDRHPWAFHAEGFRFLLVQAAMATPLLFAAMLAISVSVLRRPHARDVPWRYFALLGALSTIGFFVLGFFADNERVSFHWTTPGYLALLVIVPTWIHAWSPAWRRASWSLAAVGAVLMLGYYLAVSSPAWRSLQAGGRLYPTNFAGWDTLATDVRRMRAQLPADAQLLADNFKTGAELGFALGDADIPVLDHPLNHRHGRAPQLQLWNLQHDGTRTTPTLLVVSATDVKFSALVAYYQQLCAAVGPLPAPAVVNIDRGARRFLLFSLPATRAHGDCITPVVANIDVPQPNARLPGQFEVSGWAVKDVVGVRRVEVTLDGKVVGATTTAHANPWLQDTFLKGASRDPRLPDVQFRVDVDARAFAPGTHWMGLRLTGGDGSVEAWAERPVVLD